ncbi:cysteine hydrolase [Halomonas sp. M5N1S17]|uniref:cysteine hydrolase family protein n=1 Tax=Halomonas alkalisoli TaxID=2907158 RepID=UPI001F2E735C|nr:cysteine hydrolase [Halomonas alkalisoli]MCE9663227.1 cysteine hydrolase [Halomonas alkalisoli]
MITLHGKRVRQTLEEILIPEKTALVVIDVQNDFFDADGVFSQAGRDMTLAQAHLPNMRKLIAEWQAMDLFTVFVRQVTLPDGRGDSPAWLRLKVRDGKSPNYTLKGSWGATFCEGIEPREQDPIIEKLRPDAFLGTCLDMVLKANGIDTTVLIGANTEGCVESTVRSSAHHDYYTIVAEDAVASSNAQFHDASLALMKNRFLVEPSSRIIDTVNANRR